MASQLLATKSIDKLIAEADEPEHRLRKSLGPWSLTASAEVPISGQVQFTYAIVLPCGGLASK